MKADQYHGSGNAEPCFIEPDDITTNAKLRIIHVLSSFNVGGMEQFVIRIAEAQKRAGHDVSIMALHGGPLEEQANRIGLPYLVLNGNRVRRITQALSFFGRKRPNIVNAHNPTSMHYAVLAKLAGRPRLIVTFHGEGAGTGRKPTLREWRCTDALVTVSVAAGLQGRFPASAPKPQLIYNGVHIPPVSSVRETVRASMDLQARFVGIIVARIDELKGHRTLLEALSLLRAQMTSVTILVVGDGAERGNIEVLARKLDLDSDWVRFLGFRSDVPDLLTTADFFVLPSLTEGLPLSVLEAMAHRLPIIATPVGGIPELIRDGLHGTLVPVEDPRALANAIDVLAVDVGLRNRMANAAFQHVKDNFSFDEMTRKYLSVYQSLCDIRLNHKVNPL